MYRRYGITEDYMMQEAVSMLQGLLDAFPEFKTTPFFLELVLSPCLLVDVVMGCPFWS